MGIRTYVSAKKVVFMGKMMELKGFFWQTDRSFGCPSHTINSLIGLIITIQVNQTEGVLVLICLF